MNLPQPLTSADCDLRNFQFLPLDVVRLRDSDIAAVATGDEFRSAVLLWCASWHQVPAASLPDDDTVLSQLAGYGRVIKEWRKVKAMALRGWILCNDGRLYHPVVAEKAIEAWHSKLNQAWKTECGRISKHNLRHPDDKLDCPLFDEWLSQRTMPSCPTGQDANVLNLSSTTSTPIDRDTDTDRDRDTDIKETVSDLTSPDVIQSSSPKLVVVNGNFRMHHEWQPGDNFDQTCKLAGYFYFDPNAPPIEALMEFRSYWAAQEHAYNSHGVWEHKFIVHLKRQKMRKKS